MVENGRVFAAPLGLDSIIGLGGGSSLDCAKGINFLLTNGGKMVDYRGYGKATTPLLPMIGIPRPPVREARRRVMPSFQTRRRT